MENRFVDYLPTTSKRLFRLIYNCSWMTIFFEIMQEKNDLTGLAESYKMPLSSGHPNVNMYVNPMVNSVSGSLYTLN